MLNNPELPFHFESHPSDYIIEQASPSLIWQLLTNKNFWLGAAAVCGASFLVAHFGLACIGAATLAFLSSMQEQISSSLTLCSTLAAVIGCVGVFSQKLPTHHIEVVEQQIDDDFGYDIY
jgi:hypothetical protein